MKNKSFFQRPRGFTPHLISFKNYFFCQKTKKQEFFCQNFNLKSKVRGFTVVDLLAAATIIIIMFSFVLANFRGSQNRNELGLILKQTLGDITLVRNMSLGGQLFNGSFPASGYCINFDLSDPSRYVLFANDLVFDPEKENYSSGDELAGGRKTFNQVEFISFCGLTTNEISKLPCQESDWQNIGNFLEICFSSPDQILATDLSGQNFKYVGGVIEHKKTKQQAYFYVSLNSGLVSGDSL